MLQRHVRIALYSHDTMGLGHMRRNLLLAEELAASPLKPNILLLAGSREVNRFALARGIDVVSLPALYKDSAATYHARSLDVSLAELIAVRSATILGALKAFEPDVFVVDNVPRGAVRELDATMSYLRRRGRTRCVLGLRDILDDATDVRAEWTRAENYSAIRRNFDMIWVYGDQQVADLSQEYAFPHDIASRVQYTGYLDQRVRTASNAPSADTDNVDGKTVLCMLGGGQDGLALADAFARTRFDAPLTGLLVTGPLMSPPRRAELAATAELNPRLRMVEFISNPLAAMQAAHSVITMGGYNSVCDVLSVGARALVVPRVLPRAEQLIRAERLAARGLIDMLHPDAATPDAMRHWMTAPITSARKHAVRMHTTHELHALLDMALGTVPLRRVVRTNTVSVLHAS
jgi:predicted glycosyltransferase